MSNKKAAALLGLLAATMAEQEDKSLMRFTNPLEGINFFDAVYKGGKTRSRKKSPFTNKKLKRRAAAKAARKSRRKNR